MAVLVVIFTERCCRMLMLCLLLSNQDIVSAAIFGTHVHRFVRGDKFKARSRYPDPRRRFGDTVCLRRPHIAFETARIQARPY